MRKSNAVRLFKGDFMRLLLVTVLLAAVPLAHAVPYHDYSPDTGGCIEWDEENPDSTDIPAEAEQGPCPDKVTSISKIEKYKLEPYVKFLKAQIRHKEVKPIDAKYKDLPGSKLLPLYKTVDPSVGLNGLDVNTFNGYVAKGSQRVLDLPRSAIYMEEVLGEPTLWQPPGRPAACPAQYGGAIYTGTYYRSSTEDGAVNVSFPSAPTVGMFPASVCVTQPNGQTTCTASSVIPGYQVCDYGAAPYNQFVTNDECDLLNQIPGISFYDAADPYRHMKISAYCQKFVDGSLAAGQLPVLLSISKRASLKMKDIVKIENGYEFSCGLSKPTGGVGSLYCWGKNLNGELGLGTVGFASTHAHKVYFPGAVSPDVVDFSVAQSNVCAILAPNSANPAGSLYCWGKNDVGQIGLPITVAASGVPQKITLKYAGSRDYGSTSVGGTGYMYATSYTDLNSTGEVLKQISVGNAFLYNNLYGFTGCFVTDKKKSYCWGFNTYGQFGTGTSHNDTQVKGVVIRQAFNNTTAPSTTGVVHPSRSAGVSFWAADSIHVAGHTICILGATLGTDSSLNGKMLCSGSQQGSHGILGSQYINTTRHTISSPVLVDTSASGGALSNIKQVAANEKVICVRTDSSSGYTNPNNWNMYCWGKVPKAGVSGNLATFQYATALQWDIAGTGTPQNIDGVKSVAVGEYNVCFVREDLTFLGSNQRSYCMGINRSQMFGPNSDFTGVTTTGGSIVLGEMDFLHKFNSSTYDNCGLASSGTCSSGETIGVSSIATGRGQASVAHHCHVKGGSVYCTGENYFGQLGKAQLFIPTTSTPVMHFPYPNIPVQN